MKLRASWLARTVVLGVAVVVVGTVCGGAVAQEKRTILTENDAHWQGKLAPGQTLEIIDRNGGIDATASTDGNAQLDTRKRGHGDDENKAYVEVVEYSDGVTICAIYGRTPEQGHCHRGHVDNEESQHFWHNNWATISFSVRVPAGVKLHAMTTNGDVRAHDVKSVVEASTTNGSVDVSTSEWASGSSTNGHIDLAMGKAGWSGELRASTTNGGVKVSLPGSSAFELRASTTNGGIHSDFPVTVEGTFGPKDVHGTVGGGGRELRVTTTNGGIELRKAEM